MLNQYTEQGHIKILENAETAYGTMSFKTVVVFKLFIQEYTTLLIESGWRPNLCGTQSWPDMNAQFSSIAIDNQAVAIMQHPIIGAVFGIVNCQDGIEWFLSEISKPGMGEAIERLDMETIKARFQVAGDHARMVFAIHMGVSNAAPDSVQ